MTKRYLIYILLALAALAAMPLVSCSVKENRKACDCFVVVTVPNAEEDMVLYFYNAATGEPLGSQYCTRDDLVGGSVVVTKPAVDLRVTAVSASATVSDKGVVIVNPRTGEFPDVRGFSVTAPAVPGGEDNYVKAYAGRQYAEVTITVDAAGIDGDAADSLVLASCWKGIALPDLHPVDGLELIDFERVAPGEFRVRVPRQGDEGAEVAFYLRGWLVNTLALGERLAEKGYDWDADDLPPVHIHVHFELMSFTVTVEDWQVTDTYVTAD